MCNFTMMQGKREVQPLGACFNQGSVSLIEVVYTMSGRCQVDIMFVVQFHKTDQNVCHLQKSS